MKEKIHGITLKVWECIKNISERNGYPPTLREIAKEMDFNSTWTVRYHLKKLVIAGYIRIKKGISRGIEILKIDKGIPILGKIKAGTPEEAIENVEGYIGKFEEFFGNNDLFALRVKGDSMLEAGILDGDVVIVKKQNTAENGDIVVALVSDEATVKRFYKTEKEIKLLPANKKYKSIIISKDTKIIGKVIGVIRKY